MIRSIGIMLLSFFLIAASVLAQPPSTTNEFKPLSEVPPSEQLPGGAFVVVAYGFIWVATMAYIWLLWRRLSRVENEMQTLQRRTEAKSDRK
jgi:CcmD family protein